MPRHSQPNHENHYHNKPSEYIFDPMFEDSFSLEEYEENNSDTWLSSYIDELPNIALDRSDEDIFSDGSSFDLFNRDESPSKTDTFLFEPEHFEGEGQ